MAVRVSCITDPACAWSWAAEPALRALSVEFGAGLEWTFVMGGLARVLDAARRAEMARGWLDAAAASGMPTDPRIWHAAPPVSTYPACLAVIAAREQGAAAAERMLRALREGLLCRRRKLDHLEALAEVARDAGLDEARFRVDAASNAAVEELGRQLDIARAVPDELRDAQGLLASRVTGDERVPLPTLRFEAADGSLGWCAGLRTAREVRAAAFAAGAEPLAGPRPSPPEALERFGTLAAPELAAVCDLSPPRADLALAELVAEGRARVTAVLAGRLYEAL